MSPEEYLDRPWAWVHPAYSASFLNMRPAPEYATGEVVLASVYRAVGFGKGVISEGKVPANGRAFQKRLDKGKPPKVEPGWPQIPTEVWRHIISGTLRSPKQANQTAKRFLQISPVVPDAALYSQSARQSANSWPAGELVAKVIKFGSPDLSSAQGIWNRLFHALDVTEEDDIWARLIHSEFLAWRSPDQEDCWKPPVSLEQDPVVEAWHKSGIESIPARQFARDLDSVISLKGRLTRRQWTSMVETVLRIGTAAHVMWVCRANEVHFNLLLRVLRGEAPPDESEVRNTLVRINSFWRYGQLATGAISEVSTKFLKARAGLNLFLCLFGDITRKAGIKGPMETAGDFAGFLSWVWENMQLIDVPRFIGLYEKLLESEQRAVSGKKGIASNIGEFLRHVLGQRQTAEAGMDSYDQGYYLCKRGTHASAPWQVTLGPVAVMSIVHSCTQGSGAPRNITDLCGHLSEYGIDLQPQDVTGSSLGLTLRNLGLMTDSPDAEGGMVIKNPFEQLREPMPT